MAANRTTTRTNPTVSISSQVLAHDTGTSTLDGITSDGAVTLSGRLTGAAGTVVRIYDGMKLLGTAKLDGLGGWTYSTTLSAGTHALHAVAVDTSGRTATTAAQPAIIVETAPPVLAITSQILAQDTGPSATDRITSNGAVTLSGTIAGSAGTTVKIFDGSLYLGTATLDGRGGWSYATTLGDGTHALHAVATALSGLSATTAAQASITIDHTKPVVSYTYLDQVVGSNSVQIFGNYSGPAGTRIEIYSGTTDLGAATITGANTWQFTTPGLTDGNYSFSAVATTVAGNTATFSGVPSLTVGSVTGTLDSSRFHTVWNQDFTTTQIDRDIFPIVYGNADQFAYGPNGLTLTSYRSEGFSNVGILQANWDRGLGEGYGLYSITASHPANQGTGIAILLWPADNGWPGPELDMVEDWSDITSQTAYFSVHYKSPLDGSNMINTIRYSVDLTKANTFALDWEQGSLTYYVNGHEIFQLTGSEVPLDFAHGGINAAFGAQITDIGTNYEPTDQVSLTIYDMNYATTGAVPASIKVSNPGSVTHTGTGTAQTIMETITGVGLGTSTVYTLLLDKNNVAYNGWQAVTLDNSGLATLAVDFYATGDYLVVSTDPNNLTISGVSAAVTLGVVANTGGVLSGTVAHDHLWFERSGNDLVIEVLGTTQRTYVNNWYVGQPAQQIIGRDGLKLDGGIAALVQSMATFEAANPAFNAMTTTHTSLGDGYFGSNVMSVYAGSWHA